MINDILIISDQLVEPPTDSLAFRTITMISHDNLEMDVLFHTTQEMKDVFYHWMKPRGLMDYIDYILNELEWENGVRIDVVNYYPRTIVVKSIRFENQVSLLGNIKSLAGKE